MDERYSDGIRGSSPSDSEDSGGVSDETLDAIVEEERRDERCRTLSLSNPELASAQLKYLFPELSDYWRYW